MRSEAKVKAVSRETMQLRSPHMFHVEHFGPKRLFSNAKSTEERVEHIFGSGSPDEAIKRNASLPQTFCDYKGISVSSRFHERPMRVGYQTVLPRVECGFARFWHGTPRSLDQR